MFISVIKRFSLLCGLLLALHGGPAAQAQSAGLTPTPTPLVVPTVKTYPPRGNTVAPGDDVTLLPTPTPIPVYGRQGVLVQTVSGETVLAQNADQLFNPASVVKLSTALAALRTFGPDYRFATTVWTNGTLDAQTGTINGDLIISGRDPSLHYEHVVLIARELNRLGIRTVTGDLIVAPRFTLNFSWSAQRSGDSFYDTLDAERRPDAAVRAWQDERSALGEQATLQTMPGVAVLGAVYVAPVPPGARVLLTHRSSPLVDILKVLLCYSNNFMAERLGDTLGGAAGVERFLVSQVGLAPTDVQLASTSGLGVNRLTPRAMMKVYRALIAELAKHQLGPEDIMPVAGVDPGTLQKRYAASNGRGSVIGKTGTLPHTDGGASALTGQLRTQSGETLYFVIFDQRGSAYRFRLLQDQLINELQTARGGPAPFAYTPHTLAMRLANTALDPAKPTSADEYEPAPN